MVFKESLLLVADNSGARYVKCVGLFRNKVFVSVSEFLVVSVKKLKAKKKVKKGLLYRALLVSSRKRDNSPFSHSIFFFTNKVVLLKKGDRSPLSSRVFCSLSFKFRGKGFSRLLSMSSECF